MNPKIVLLFLISSVLIVSTIPAYADTNSTKIPIMSPLQREQIFDKLPNFQGGNINYFFEIIITPTGVKETNVVLSQSNYTALKNNVAFFTACGGFNNGLCQPPVITSSSPTTNYCPLALKILLNQDGYISKLYNVTKGVDLTGYVYPSYCYTETGPNPINGQGIPSVPEFPTGLLVFTLVFVGIFLLGGLVDGHWFWQFPEVRK